MAFPSVSMWHLSIISGHDGSDRITKQRFYLTLILFDSSLKGRVGGTNSCSIKESTTSKEIQVSNQIPPTSIRLPEDLKRWLGHRAVDNGVSLTKEVLSILYTEMKRGSDSEDKKAA